MGRFVVRTLHRSGEINEIVAADRDANRAAAVAELYDSSVRSTQVDTDNSTADRVVRRGQSPPRHPARRAVGGAA